MMYPYNSVAYRRVSTHKVATLGQRSIQWRTMHGVDGKPMSRIQLVKMANLKANGSGIRISYQDVYNYEHEKYCPKDDKFTVLADIMAVNPDWLKGYDVHM